MGEINVKQREYPERKKYKIKNGLGGNI